MQHVVHEYFKREFDDFTVLVQLNPVDYTGVELTIPKSGTIEKRKLEFDEDIYEDLKVDGFAQSSALEFNIYLKGLKS
ncbi:hypothetical protein E1176_10340 [Fulvivirga sp. RKSG066]|uniref:hypothetical protein n=1 Tax=Fulvivirga aurantia TaxID=2529383 RepID=UPI0012BBFD62|nr:hypothetical protein [Fulvivirga aurantia]MTI21417.1 hypothetical protein [Fulvivirga aurantia]